MFSQHDFRFPWARIKPYVHAAGRLKSHLNKPLLNAESAKVIGAVVVATIAAVVIVALPDESGQSSASADTANASASMPADVTCENRAWPYLDHRCAQPTAKEAPLATRNVRVVSTDRGTSTNLVTAVPIIEAKRPAEIPELQASMAKLAPPTSEPEVAPAQEKAALSPVQERVSPEAPATTEPTVVSEAAAAKAKAKAARAEEKRVAKSKRERRIKTAPTEMAATAETAGEARQKGVPADVVAAVKAATSDERNPNAAPADVVDAVKAITDGRRLTQTYKSRDGRRITISQKDAKDSQDAEEVVTVSSSKQPAQQRLFLVPRESENNNNWNW